MNQRITTEIIDVHSLLELLGLVEAEISQYTSLKESYSEQLGNLLRGTQEKHGDEEWFKRLSLGEKLPKGKAKAPKKEEKGGKGKKKGKKGKKGGGTENWIQFQSMSLSSGAQGEAELMFEAVESITAKISELGEAKSVLEELRGIGLGDDVSYLVYIQEGVPRKIVVKPAGAEVLGKFTFSGGFTGITILEQKAIA